jgi:Tol biopolymer transport system component/DNA-binding winged helix-turn-helix (wHTH) protein
VIRRIFSRIRTLRERWGVLESASLRRNEAAGMTTPPTRPAPVVRFGPFELDVRAGELRKDGARVNLQGQPIQVLARLLERPGEMVTREELRQALWPGDTFVDFEHGLNAAVKRLRAALGDTADSLQFIETLPRRGYRFVAPVDSAPGAVPEIESPVPSEAASPTPYTRPLVRRTLAAVVLASVLLLALAVGTRDRASGGDPAQRTLTRLTFDPGLQTDPTWSPDGRFMAYASDRSGTFDIWVQPVAGGDPVQVTKSPAADTQPSWSPDGSTIVFRSERDGGGLYLVPALGGPERRLARGGVHASWSADGQMVWFLEETFQSNGAKLFSVTLDGEVTQVLPDFTSSGLWSWIAPHPDGRVSFLGRHLTDGDGLFTVSTDGAAVRRTSWSGPPFDGQRVAFTRFRWKSRGDALCIETGDGLSQIQWLIRVDPKTLAVRSSARLTTGATSDVGCVFSPGGSRLLFSAQHNVERVWQFSFDADGNRLGEGRGITPEDAVTGGISVSPDGRRLLHHRRRVGEHSSDLWLTDVDTGRSELFAESRQGAVWTDDSREVVSLRVRWNPFDVSDGGLTPTQMVMRSLDGGEYAIGPWSNEPLLWPSAWIVDRQELLVARQTLGRVDLVAWSVTRPSAAAPSRVVLADPGAVLWGGTVSPDRRWLAVLSVPNATRRALVGITSVDGPPHRGRHHVASHLLWTDKPQWSGDGRTLYFQGSVPSAFLNLLAIRVDIDRGIPVGEPVQISDFSSPAFRISPYVQRTAMGIVDDRVFLTMLSSTGHIWMLDNVDR